MGTDDSATTELGIDGLEDPVEVGIGGFATVYKAFQPAFRRTVAVKILAAVNLDDEAKKKFERECQAMGSLSEHPNIVTVYGAGFTNLHGSRPYMIMAYLPGGSLADRIDANGPLGWEETSLIGVHLAGALETAHRADIIHRDIKPANVLMSSYGDAQLTDFGIARVAGGHETQSGVITASMAHAPPEVLDGQKPTVAADVYSLGSTLFELLWGSPAFQVAGDESMVPMLRRILTADPPDLRERGVPDAICQVIEKAMAKDPAARQRSAVALGRELQQARRAVGLDPGKLTVPTDLVIEDEEEVTFTDAPATGQMDAVATPTPPAPSSRHTTTLGTGPVGAPPVVEPAADAAPAAAPVEKKRKTGLLVGVGALVVLAVVAIAVVALTVGRNNNQTVAVAPVAETTTIPPTDYSDASQSEFVERCATNGNVTQNYCRCVYLGIKEKVPFTRFRELEQEQATNPDAKVAEGPELRPILLECAAKNNIRRPPRPPSAPSTAN